MAAQGSQLTNKYAEGYPGKRYYGGCEFVDVAEQLAIDRAKKLFHADAANVQPHSGAQANQAVFFAALKPGDTILGMSLPHGGHLTHGSPVNMSGKWFKVVAYGLDPETELIDYDAAERLAHEHKPKLIIAGASAYSRVIDWKRFREIADSVGAQLMVDMAHYAGLDRRGRVSHAGRHRRFRHHARRTRRCAGPRGGLILTRAEHEKAINSAVFPGLQGGPLMHVIAAKAVAFGEALQRDFKVYQERVLENARVLATRAAATAACASSPAAPTRHMFLRRPAREEASPARTPRRRSRRAHITVNKNAIPNDPEKPFVTSGIRIGSPAITTRGFTEIECEELAHLIADVLDAPRRRGDADARRAASVAALTPEFPVYR